MTANNVRHPLLIMLLAGLFACAWPVTGGARGPTKDGWEEFRQEVEASGVGAQRLASRAREEFVRLAFDRRFGKLFRPGRLARLDDAALANLFEATNLASFYEDSTLRAEQLLHLIHEKQERNLTTTDDLSKTFGALLAARLFVTARVFRDRHQELAAELLPEVVQEHDGSSPSWYEFAATDDDGEAKLIRRAADLSREFEIVVIAHPRCHFTQAAVSAISTDPELREAFSNHSRWLVPPGRKLELEAIGEWNREFSAFPLLLAHHREEWELFASWDTPTFYFLRSGNVSESVAGWPAGGNADAIKAAIARGSARAGPSSRNIE